MKPPTSGRCGISISTTDRSRCSRPAANGNAPIALGILDDHSRLCCHVQWYLSETAEDLVHGLSQAIQKRGLPRALLTDNGSAMVAEEVTEGLLRLGIVHERTLPYSPYQKGYASSCTSFVFSGEALGNRRGSVLLMPCRLSGRFVPTGSYRYSGLSL